MNTTKTMHFYLRTNERRPVGVVALRLHGDDEVRVAMSLCHPNDQWDADLGVAAARARLESERMMRSTVARLKRTQSVAVRKPLLINLALELKPHGTAVKDQDVGIDWPLAQQIFERHIDHLLNPAKAETTEPGA